MNLEKLQQEWDKDTHIDHTQLDMEALKTSNLHHKYLDLLMFYRAKISKLDRDYLTMKGIRSKYFSGQFTKAELEEYGWEQYQYKAPLKAELERLLETDEVMLSIKDKALHYTLCFEYVEEVMKSIRSRSYDIKTAVEWKKFQAGM